MLIELKASIHHQPSCTELTLLSKKVPYLVINQLGMATIESCKAVEMNAQ